MNVPVRQLLHTADPVICSKYSAVINSVLEVHSSGTDELVVASSSMHPTLKTGDKITVEPVEPDKIQVGQVVVFKSESGKLIVHRVVKKEGFVLVTAGDSLRRFDSPVHVYDVIGAVKDLEIARPLSKCFRIIRAIKRRIFKYPF
ncbi:MAG: Peptidase S24-like protein [Bacteroidetes bacterium ADurb.Bin397]|nr:MAG: Peptidase S24-like protein [Bacteroidetes bacterium ADurb.Bin397]